MAAMTPLRSTWGARAINGVVARAAVGDEAAAVRTMRWLTESGGEEIAILSTIDKNIAQPSNNLGVRWGHTHRVDAFRGIVDLRDKHV